MTDKLYYSGPRRRITGPRIPTVTKTVKLPVPINDWLRNYCFMREQSQQDVILQAIEQYLAAQERHVDNFDKIIEAAKIMRRYDRGEEAFEHVLGQMNHTEMQLVTFAGKMLEGKCYCVSTDNLKSAMLERYRALAKHLGAGEEAKPNDAFIGVPGLTYTLFKPPGAIPMRRKPVRHVPLQSAHQDYLAARERNRCETPQR